ncbi:MAG: succinylglutamate desuccinylase/aspartoacylase family protein [Pseudomonadota bacterium]
MSSRRNQRNAAPVKTHYSFIKIMTGSDLSRRRLPIMSAESVNPGPLVWLTACGHGDEVSGIVVIQEIFKNIRQRLLCGTIRAFPLMNPLGFEMGSRHITMSREDLNRSFPGNSNGSLGERIAYRIFAAITEEKPALVLDLHNDWIESIPYILLDHYPGILHKSAYMESIKVCKNAGLCLIVEPDDIKTSLSFNLLLHDIPALTLELGKPNVVSESNVTYGLETIWNILAHLGMVDLHNEPFQYPLAPGYGQGVLLKYSDKPYSSKTGIIRFLAKPGDVVKAGQRLAKNVNAFGKNQETITAIEDAIVLGHSDSSAAFPGMPIMAFGVRKSPAPENRETDSIDLPDSAKRHL